MGTYAIAVLAGDGIGPEVTAQGVRVLEAMAERFGHHFKMTEALVGVAAIEAEGDAISNATMQLCQESDAILFGAVGGRSGGVLRYEELNSKVQPERALFRLRKELALYANLRPIRPFDALLNASTIKADILRGTDLLVVRELTGDLLWEAQRDSGDSTGARGDRYPGLY